jgi:hypothetical protein
VWNFCGFGLKRWHLNFADFYFCGLKISAQFFKKTLLYDKVWKFDIKNIHPKYIKVYTDIDPTVDFVFKMTFNFCRFLFLWIENLGTGKQFCLYYRKQQLNHVGKKIWGQFCLFELCKECLNSDGQKFYQYEQNKRLYYRKQQLKRCCDKQLVHITVIIRSKNIFSSLENK